MKNEFDMSDLGALHHFLGLEVAQTKAGIFVCYKKYLQDVLDIHGRLRFNHNSNGHYYKTCEES